MPDRPRILLFRQRLLLAELLQQFIEIRVFPGRIGDWIVGVGHFRNLAAAMAGAQARPSRRHLRRVREDQVREPLRLMEIRLPLAQLRRAQETLLRSAQDKGHVQLRALPEIEPRL